jgi:MFS family permease
VTGVLALLRREPKARVFFLALAQSSLGTGAAYVGLLLLAYQRLHTPWGVSLVLLADFLPPMLLGPLVGAAADRWPRRRCVVLADVVRALAFVGIAVFDSYGSTLAFALAAGLGTALFRPAALAGVPGLVAPERMPAATSLFSAVTEVGWTVGPGLAAIALLIAPAEDIMFLNGVTFAVSAVLLSRLPLANASPMDAAETKPSLLREGLTGWRTTAAIRDVRTVILAASVAMFFGGIFNVGELLFAKETLNAGDTGYSILVTVYGVGFLVGSVAGSAGGSASYLKRRFLQGLALTALGSVCIAFAPNLGVAIVGFTVGGAGNGVVVVHERLLIQTQVPMDIQGRAFGLLDALTSGGFVLAFLCAGVTAATLGPRGLLTATAIGEVVLTAAAVAALRPRLTLVPADVPAHERGE